MTGIPDVILGAGAMAVFAFVMLGMMGWILKSQQALITNHISSGTRALVDLKHSVDRLADKL